MTDREKVIYDLERCTCHVPDACRDCSKYNSEGIPTMTCMESLMSDALELLEEQKSIMFDNDGHHIRCTNCGEYWCETDAEGNKFPHRFCPNCGRKVKWDD